VFTRRTIPFIIGSILLVAVAFLFLTRALDWTYVSELYKDEPAVVVVPDAEPVRTVELELGVMLPEEQYNELVLLSQRVSELHPHIRVKIKNFFDDHLTFEEWEKLAQLGGLGDVQLVNNEWVVPLAIQGLFQPVDRLMNNDVLSDQFPSVVDALRWNGYMWAIPYETNPYILFMHKQAFEEAESNDLTPEITIPFVLDESLALKGGVIPTNPSSEQDEQQDQPEMMNLSFEYLLDRYQQAKSFEGPLMSIDSEHMNGILVWLSMWYKDQDQPMQLGMLNETQYDALHFLQQNVELMKPSMEIVESSIPFLYLVTLKQYYEQRELIDTNYVTSKLQIPLPWLNGKSFMISAGTKEAEAAMLWLETLNRYQPEGTVVHRKIYASYSNDSMQLLIKDILQQKLLASQHFAVDLHWVKRYEQLEQQWREGSSLSEKLEVFMNGSQ